MANTERMDPLTELKSLLNIPEGMTAEEAKRRANEAARAVSQGWAGSVETSRHHKVYTVWSAIRYVVEQDKRDPSV